MNIRPLQVNACRKREGRIKNVMSIEGNKNKKARSVTFDVMKCIGIILVIIGNLKEYSQAFSFIYSFHMLLFFIIGGYFFHSKPTSVSLKSDIKRLIYPYIITGQPSSS